MADIRFARQGRLGRITLDRPHALNALTHAMVQALAAQLTRWADDPAVAVVAIEGAGERAFCAGGDIRALYDLGQRDLRAALDFFVDEYRLNAQIRAFPKPYVAVMDGVTFGGGVGVSVHGSRRIATPRTVLAMPECGIGLIPDVGTTWVLPRLPGRVGRWLGLTGARLCGAEAVQAGVCDLLLDDLAPMWVALADGEVPGAMRLGALPDQGRIDQGFAGDDVATILARLEAMGEWGTAQAALIRAKSPMAIHLTARALQRGAALDLADCLAMEFRLVQVCLARSDFYEGVRAAVIDRDRAPRWSPARFEEVDPALVEAAFAGAGGGP